MERRLLCLPLWCVDCCERKQTAGVVVLVARIVLGDEGEELCCGARDRTETATGLQGAKPLAVFECE